MLVEHTTKGTVTLLNSWKSFSVGEPVGWGSRAAFSSHTTTDGSPLTLSNLFSDHSPAAARCPTCWGNDWSLKRLVGIQR